LLLLFVHFYATGGPNTWKTVMSCVREKEPVTILLFKGVGGASDAIAKKISHDWLQDLGNRLVAPLHVCSSPAVIFPFHSPPSAVPG
jgi:hypothetical protein